MPLVARWARSALLNLQQQARLAGHRGTPRSLGGAAQGGVREWICTEADDRHVPAVDLGFLDAELKRLPREFAPMSPARNFGAMYATSGSAGSRSARTRRPSSVSSSVRVPFVVRAMRRSWSWPSTSGTSRSDRASVVVNAPALTISVYGPYQSHIS